MHMRENQANWKRLSCRLTIMSLAMAWLVGCGGSSDQPELGEVTGTITLDGKPLSGVAVVFQPENGRPARGMTDANGKYELTYIRQTKGSKVGPNRVEIAPSEEGESEESEGSDTVNANLPARQSTKAKIPARYNLKSELNAEVKPGKNTFDFELKS